MTANNFAAVRRRLLSWYDVYKRDLPWRRTADPYAIWIAETMLQQTQVSTVVSYYERFMKAFPCLAALDRAPLARVLAIWSGLGYYRRAENLKKAGRLLRLRHRGRLPDDYAALRRLPGIGDYTAGALLSIAFGQRYPAVDGNARRVLARLFMLRNDREIRDAASRLVPPSSPGRFNQALMELGHTVCIPKNPRCVACPLNKLCAAQQKGDLVRGSLSKRRTMMRAVMWPMAIVRHRGKILLQRRAAGGILSGLWELPGGEKLKRVAVRTALREQLQRIELSGAKASRLGEISHSITNRSVRAPVFLIDALTAPRLPVGGTRYRWVAPSALDRHPISSLTRKAARLLSRHEKDHL